MKILVFGNKLFDEDNLVLKILPGLKKIFPEIDFIESEPNETFLKERNLVILDVAKGIKKVTLIEDLNNLNLNKIYSMHDFDLTYNLKILKKINLIDRVNIICVPYNLSSKDALYQTQLILRKCVAQLIQGS